ncbi:MAG: diguanylate cyclase [Gammaproteobacteria bacterium]|nr:diguanylate cyclase [Gammaproteobacteria bacterium]
MAVEPQVREDHQKLYFVEDRQAPSPAWRGLLPISAFYFAWIGLAWLSSLYGRTTIDLAAGILLLGGIGVTNGLLAILSLAAPRDTADSGHSAVATAQTGLAIAWTTVYAVLADGPGELVLGMYLTAVLVAFSCVSSMRLRLLGFAAAGGYAMSLAVRYLSTTEATSSLAGDALQAISVALMIAVLGRRARQTEATNHNLTRRVDQLQQEVERVSRSAERDFLTKSFNRQYIMDALVREKARADRTGRSFSVVIFDLDRFKSLNDTHGHLVGDRVLAAFAQRAKRALRSMDAINPTRFRRALGRLGGEEFIAVLPGTEVGGALRCAERVRESMASEPVDGELSITVSAGVAEYRRGEALAEFLTRADQALYAAKRGGRNRVRVGVIKTTPDGGGQKPKLRIIR